jgi:HEAT repeat protein
MDNFAAQALGQLGSVSTATLLPLVTDKDARISQRALLALTSYADEQALPTIITLADSTDARVRLQAIRALGAYHTDAVVEKLLTLLSSDDPAQLIATCNALGRTKDRRAIAALVQTIERSVVKPISDNNVRSAAGDALEAITGKQFGPFEQNWRRAFDAGTL